jgi:ABC-type phosphate transport system substrate-binding protein
VRAFKLTPLPLLAFVVLSATAAAQSRPQFRVIVHPSNPVTSVDQRFLADAFLKKVTRWAHDEAIRPVDLHVDSTVRRHFSDDALKRSVAAVKSYWQQLVFSGRGVPPPEMDNDEQVVKFVLRNPGAIGYVSGTANVEGAKVVFSR